MKKIISVLLFVSGVLAACTKKALPIITQRTTDPAPPVSKTIAIKPDLAQGKTIFMNRCNRCHDLPKPEQYSSQRWESILTYMIPRARLDDAQAVHVRNYLKTNAAK